MYTNFKIRLTFFRTSNVSIMYCDVVFNIAELKFGKYWSKAERKEQLEKSRMRKLKRKDEKSKQNGGDNNQPPLQMADNNGISSSLPLKMAGKEENSDKTREEDEGGISVDRRNVDEEIDANVKSEEIMVSVMTV